MSDYAATALSLTLVNGFWRDVISRIFAYLRNQHEPYPSLPQEGSLLTVDSSTRRIMSSPQFDLSKTIGDEPKNSEYWCSVSAEIWFGGHSSFINIQARGVRDNQTYVEIWFPSRVYETIFCFDPDFKEFSPEAKSDLIRLFIGISKELGAVGFGYRLAGGDSLFGPPAIESLRDYVEIGGRSLGHELELIVAGMASSFIEEGKFEYDLYDHPVHYRQSGYYLYDILWPPE
jgi:hypothetical protein